MQIDQSYFTPNGSPSLPIVYRVRQRWEKIGLSVLNALSKISSTVVADQAAGLMHNHGLFISESEFGRGRFQPPATSGRGQYEPRKNFDFVPPTKRVRGPGRYSNPKPNDDKFVLNDNPSDPNSEFYNPNHHSESVETPKSDLPTDKVSDYKPIKKTSSDAVESLIDEYERTGLVVINA